MSNKRKTPTLNIILAILKRFCARTEAADIAKDLNLAPTANFNSIDCNRIIICRAEAWT